MRETHRGQACETFTQSPVECSNCVCRSIAQRRSLWINASAQVGSQGHLHATPHGTIREVRDNGRDCGSHLHFQQQLRILSVGTVDLSRQSPAVAEGRSALIRRAFSGTARASRVVFSSREATASPAVTGKPMPQKENG